MKRVLMGVSLFALIGVSMGANQVWDITPLDPTIFPGGFTGSNVWSINNNKQIIGEVWRVIDGIMIGHTPAVWDFSDPKGWGVSHTMTPEIPAMKLIWPHFYQINDSGQVCGNYSYACPGHESEWNLMDRPMIYDIYSRTARDLGSLGDDEDGDPFLDFYLDCYVGYGLGINNAGTVVGKSQPFRINAWGYREAWLFEPTSWIGGAKPIDMGETNSELKRINNKNLMIGSRSSLVEPERAYKQSGQMVTMLPLPPDCSGWSSSAEGLNDLDMIVGYTWRSGYSQGILWNPDGGIVRLPNYPGTDSGGAVAINKHGMIVGTSNGAVVWMGAGDNYQVVSLNMFAAQSGWQLMFAYDINDDGWIIGRGTFNGVDMGFLARPRLDENPPLANLDSDNVTNEDGRITIGVLYYDDNGMNTATMDNKDIEVIYPDGTRVAAEFKSVTELTPESETGKRKYRAMYSFSTPLVNPMNPDGINIRVEVAESEVSDMSGRYVPKGAIGELELSIPSSTVTILKGSNLDVETSTTTWTFETHLYTGAANEMIEVLGIAFQPPGSSIWIPMTSSGDGDWKYVQTASSAAALAAFGDGDYTYRISLDFGGPFEIETVFTFGEDAEGDSIDAPVSSPTITSPQQGQTVSHKNINLAWQQPMDPAVTSMICSVVDTASGSEVFGKVISGGTASSAGTVTLQPDCNYEMTVYFCSGFQNNPEEDDWTSYKLKYTSTRVSFSTQQYVGDINNDNMVDMQDLSVLSSVWKKTSSQAGWNAQYDLQPNGAIDLGDLVFMAENWLK